MFHEYILYIIYIYIRCVLTKKIVARHVATALYIRVTYRKWHMKSGEKWWMLHGLYNMVYHMFFASSLICKIMWRELAQSTKQSLCTLLRLFTYYDGELAQIAFALANVYMMSPQYHGETIKCVSLHVESSLYMGQRVYFCAQIMVLTLGIAEGLHNLPFCAPSKD